jgi:uncharacterized protein YecE (DUF72 family)
MAIGIGTAGWSIPRDVANGFPDEGSGLERYACCFRIAEINSSFHRPHRISTWARWRDSVPDDFRFSVKIPKQITHVSKLVGCEADLAKFMGDAETLGTKLAVLLVQLPPKLAFDARIAEQFFSRMREISSAAIACEPRHPSWFEPDADNVLQNLQIARVAADPAICDAAAKPGAWGGLSYWPLHGSPVVYRSSYSDRIGLYAAELEQEVARDKDLWCIFDNTASSAGAADALMLMEALGLACVPKSDRSEPRRNDPVEPAHA